jgi:hypothetical protein
MAAIPGSIPLTGFIAPTDTADTFSTHDSDYGRGDKHVSNITTRDLITEDRRKWGMLCHVYNDGANSGTYQLTYGSVDTDITNNANWQVFSGSEGGKLATDSVDLVALVTAAPGDKATIFTLAADPLEESYIIISVNGKTETVGDAITTKAFYFSDDSGATAKSFSSVNPIKTGDELFIGSGIAYNLDASDRISIYQLK